MAIGPDNPNLPVVYYAPGEAGPKHVIDHNAFRSGLDGKLWIAGKRQANSLAAFQELTGYEQGSVLTDFSAFERADETAVFAKGRQFVLPQDVDLTPKADSAIVDAGVSIPGVNNDYAGAAPDMGALERGRPAPVCGPRSGPYVEKLAAHRRAPGDE